MTTFAQLIDQAWADHGDAPQEVADRLSVAAGSIGVAENVPAYAAIVTHVMGEHLGEWDRGIALLESLRHDPDLGSAAAAQDALRRGVATLRYAGGDPAAITALGTNDRVAVLAAAAGAQAGRGAFDAALATYANGVTLAAALPPGASAFRALAIAGNNLAATLEEQLARTPDQTQGMVAAAHGALAFWRLAGTWLEEERAHYRLARSHLAANDPVAAVEAGTRCAQVCQEHDAPAFERFFAYAVLARALHEAGRRTDAADMRSEAFAWFAHIPEGERHWCEADLAELA
ncbi:MAG: hypothetical protein IT516_06630 [Burkholderiales bacterium]|nr:hypothetical protein [Burkholderiales bacterium]